MTVAVAHQPSAIAPIVLLQAVQEAKYRHTDLAVLHAVDSVDPDREEAYRLGVSDEIEKLVGSDSSVSWKLHLAVAGDDRAETLLGLVDGIDVELIVIGARRRSPVGKAFLGSAAQTIILDAKVPVLVVKGP